MALGLPVNYETPSLATGAGPLEVWLKEPKQCVGWIRNIQGVKANWLTCVRLERHDADDLDPLKIRFDPSAIVVAADARSFSLTTRHHELDFSDIAAVGLTPALAAKKIPIYAVQNRLYDRDVYRFNWSVLELDYEQYDWVFDLPEFEPEDSHPDLDMRAATPAIAIRGEDIVDGTITAKAIRHGTISGITYDKIWLDEFETIEPSLAKDLVAAHERRFLKSMYEGSWPIVGSAPDTTTSTTVEASSSTLTVETLEHMMDELPAAAKRPTFDYFTGGRRMGQKTMMESMIRSRDERLRMATLRCILQEPLFKVRSS